MKFSRYFALAKAETTQFLRNKTLLSMGLIFPIGIGLLSQQLAQGGEKQVVAATSMEVFFLITLMFVQYYSVLSMATTRRDERVLKRLRTGEARDGEIMLAISTPGVLLSVILTALMITVLAIQAGEMPNSTLLLFVGLALGLVISTALAFLTSRMTSNAEAAQMTSLPVIVLAMLSQSPLLAIFPDDARQILEFTPFALIGQLSFIDWAGAPLTELTGGGEIAEGFAVFGAAGVQIAALAVWAIVLSWLSVRFMKWETNR